jgi:hypothetical protein
MSLVVEIFRSDDYVSDGEIPLVPVLRAVFEEIIGPDPAGVMFELYFYQLMDLTPDRGQPALENLRASHGYVRVRILRDGELIYQHPHPVRELIGEPLRGLLRKRDPEITHWGYGVRGPGLEAIALTRPAPQVENEMRVRPDPRPRLTFTVEEMPEPEPEQTTLAALGVGSADGTATPSIFHASGDADLSDEDPEGTGPDGTGPDGTDATAQVPSEQPGDASELRPRADITPAVGPPVVVVIPDEIVSSLLTTYPFSDEIEEGGFLVGTVYRDAERPGGYLVHVTAVLPAQRTGASMINFTFTGESFLRVSQQLESREDGEKLLGWYHTHLFAATSRSGLSSVDVELHRSTFRRPWQVAALVNIAAKGRVLRFYHGEGDEMALVPYWTVPSHDAASPGPAVTAADTPEAEPDPPMEAELS